MQLQTGTILQSGKYLIIRTLGQGGFGITYEAEQVNLNRKVAIKEFFMRDCCERAIDSSRMIVPTQKNQELVEKFRGKFIREAKLIASFNNPYIVHILDVFEENDTAYYVMDMLNGGSLADIIKNEGHLNESTAEKYIRQVAEALSYVHDRNTVHLDVKPSNILLNDRGQTVLIDFGISKHYDEFGEQTSTTPVGYSPGYAPLEQNRVGDVSQFTPASDIYALGATLYSLISGKVPPEASVVNEHGLSKPPCVSDRLWTVIEASMQPHRKDRPQNIKSFLSLMNESITSIKREDNEKTMIPKTPISQRARHIWVWIVFGVLTGTSAVSFIMIRNERKAVGTVSRIRISSTPPGGLIFFDGKNTQRKTPITLNDVSFGAHSILLHRDGYNDYTDTLLVLGNEQYDVHYQLVPEESNALPDLIRVEARNIVRLSERFNVVFTFEGKLSPNYFSWNPGDDFWLVWGPTKNVTEDQTADYYINGNLVYRAHTSYEYVLRPKRIGKFQLPPATVELNGASIRSSTIEIEVVDDSVETIDTVDIQTNRFNVRSTTSLND